MSRKFISGILAASIAISALSAVPARANERDAARVVAGLTALFILGKAIENGRRDKATVTRHPGPSRAEILRRQREQERARARARERERQHSHGAWRDHDHHARKTQPRRHIR